MSEEIVSVPVVKKARVGRIGPSRDLNKILMDQQITIELEGDEDTEDYKRRFIDGAYRGLFRLGKFEMMAIDQVVDPQNPLSLRRRLFYLEDIHEISFVYAPHT